ncbi:hypothetical protein QJS04_geneDACA009789 [Acorus gramineus]|uniref:DUF3456 domain-containing protein n=1 Tax=Acorus gramineus TaxID=55184 RepID=A0AAV9BAH9_ACOGR|nr:hypothetical protein QJS04_geneDACA009789 [Acorus gramineus]
MEEKTRLQRLRWVTAMIMLTNLARVASIDDKCSACNAEKPRNHLDLRHRLDSKGQREGKVIDYRVSELRVVELFDGLCEKMQDYTLMKLDASREEWIKVKDWDSLETDKREARAYSKDISSFCGRLLEETEDELAELIRAGSVKRGEVSKVLCQDLSRKCVRTRGTSNSVDTRDDEL